MQSGNDAPSADFVLAHLEPSDNPAMLGRLGHYEILEIIGQGGMGVVLKGYDRELNRYVAVKVLAPHLAASGAARQRFSREAQAAAAIVHPNVLAIHAVESSSALPYLVMPLVSGETLQQRIDREGPLDLKDILRITLQAAQSLAAAHSQGLVHRDVKPANILLDGSVDRVLLSDFGLARAVDDATLTRSGVIAGTPHYMSPEQARGDAVDSRSDLFSLGSVLFAMSTGRPPFRAETPLGIARRIDDAEARPVHEINEDLPAWLDVVRARLMARSPDDRFSSAAEVAELLEQCLAHVQQPTAAPLPALLSQQLQRARMRRLARAGIVAVGVVALVLAATQLPSTMDSDDPNSQASADAGAGTDNGSRTNPLSQSASEPATGLAAFWDDHLDAGIREFDTDLARFETETQPLLANPSFLTNSESAPASGGTDSNGLSSEKTQPESD